MFSSGDDQGCIKVRKRRCSVYLQRANRPVVRNRFGILGSIAAWWSSKSTRISSRASRQTRPKTTCSPPGQFFSLFSACVASVAFDSAACCSRYSGDGRLSVYDLRKNVLAGKSDELDDELLSVSVIKNGKKVVCGSQDGVLVIFSWGTWGDMSDRFPGHPESVETVLKVDEDTLLTGSSDGIVRYATHALSLPIFSMLDMLV